MLKKYDLLNIQGRVKMCRVVGKIEEKVGRGRRRPPVTVGCR